MLFLPFAVACGLIYGQRRRQLLLADRDVRRLRRGDAALVGEELSRHRALRAHDVAGRCEPLRRLEPAGHGGQRHAFRAGVRSGPAEQRCGRDRASDGFEYRLDRRFRQAAWDWACANPGRVVQLAGIKFLRIWNFWPNEPSFAAWPVRLAVLASYLPLMLLAALGLRRAVGCGWPGALCWLPAVYFTLLHTVFVSSIRYRQPAMLGLIVLAAGYLARVRKGPFKPRNGIAAIFPKRLINFCWFWFKWGLIACVIGAALLVPYFYHRMDEEIRRRVEELLAKQYPGLQVKLHSAVLMKGEGIALRGLSIIDPAAEGPGAELLSYDECFLACPTDLSDLCSGQSSPRG